MEASHWQNDITISTLTSIAVYLPLTVISSNVRSVRAVNYINIILVLCAFIDRFIPKVLERHRSPAVPYSTAKLLPVVNLLSHRRASLFLISGIFRVEVSGTDIFVPSPSHSQLFIPIPIPRFSRELFPSHSHCLFPNPNSHSHSRLLQQCLG